ncbi:MAG: helix-turn-helix domain-containing protein [Treponema sp.]|jgi:transcriptional regulator with XRE-family HTH domain|nr:helix-turn-helix domain-containing protein [Treponema sp.]
MARKRNRAPGNAGEISITPRQGCWIQYKLKLNNLTQIAVAKKANRSTKMVSHFLNGRKGSDRISKALAAVLGYPSFEAVIATIGRETV